MADGMFLLWGANQANVVIFDGEDLMTEDQEWYETVEDLWPPTVSAQLSFRLWLEYSPPTDDVDTGVWDTLGQLWMGMVVVCGSLTGFVQRMVDSGFAGFDRSSTPSFGTSVALRLVALHGLPTSPRLWERLVLPTGWHLECPAVPGLGEDGTPSDWSLSSCVQALSVQCASADVIIGHDMGGVLAAMCARPTQTVVLSGTALAVYWWAIRATAWPLAHRWLYQRHGGHRFVTRFDSRASRWIAFGIR